MKAKLKPEKRARKSKGYVQKKLHSSVIQPHHITYASLDGTVPDWVVNVWKGEHFCLTLMGRRKRISKGFIISLKDWIEKHEKYAEDLKLNET